MNRKPELIIDAKATLGESPSWDKMNQSLYWVDILENKLFIYNVIKKKNKEFLFDQNVSCVAPKNNNEVVLAMKNGFYMFNLQTEKLTFINDPEEQLINNRFNDGKCDPAGRFWAGTMNTTGKVKKGSLYCLDKEFVIKKKLNGVSTSNGIAWSNDNKKMYYIDTPTNQIVMFDYDYHSGNIQNQRLVVKIPSSHGLPDGMTIDRDGMLWVANWGGGKVSQWNPETGELIDEISIPCSLVTSCVFGGENLDTLFVTTARVGMDREQLLREPYAGGVFSIKLNTVGCETFYFKGNS